ncbi:MarR family winged helix-turn-helix transcriptional regulator [Sporosalibacterium faouarense]|uniref:MarR family winged helix-turn-helix transcriptional regulator n=1 Tax=Sporosalibacterium faouarense TaxID=516123 RepID=UPI001FAED325|nr:MarR family transcriptional regulator [Sporosalibacterium faouarense]
MKNIDVGESVIGIERYLRKTDHIIRKKGREILKDFNITGPQFIALQWLISDGDLTIGELSQKMKLACSTITDLIDRMEKNELVVRTKDKKDKRVVRIQVLKKGHDVVDKVLDKRRLFLSDKLRNFKEEDKTFLMKSLESLYLAMKGDNQTEEE